MMQELDNQIIVKASKGDKLAFRSIVLHYAKVVNSLAYRYTQDSSAAEDIAQETFIKAFKAINSYQAKARFSTWLFRISTNASIDYLRKHKNLKATDSLDQESLVANKDLGTTLFPEQLDMNQQIHKAMRGLTETERLAFTMKHHQGFSISETAIKLNINNNACKQTIYRAVQKLRKYLTPMVNV